VTTIASDGKTVAADSLRVGGGEIIDATTPKLVIYQKMLFGFTGTMALFRPAVRWYELGAKPGEQPNVGDDKAHWSLYRFLPEGADRYPSRRARVATTPWVRFMRVPRQRGPLRSPRSSTPIPAGRFSSTPFRSSTRWSSGTATSTASRNVTHNSGNRLVYGHFCNMVTGKTRSTDF
jgi:hypothetical protein